MKKRKYSKTSKFTKPYKNRRYSKRKNSKPKTRRNSKKQFNNEESSESTDDLSEYTKRKL